MNKAYCGIGQPRSGYHLGTFDECMKKKQLRRFGALKLTVREKKIIDAYEQQLKQNRNAKRRLAPKKPKKPKKKDNNIAQIMKTKAKKAANKDAKKILNAQKKANRDANKLLANLI